MSEDKKVHISCKISEELYVKLKVHSVHSRLTMSQIIEQLLKEAPFASTKD